MRRVVVEDFKVRQARQGKAGRIYLSLIRPTGQVILKIISNISMSDNHNN
jgi:hypothetical protein